MALSAKLVMRQGQTLVMTPQLMQAIKLLQLSNLELASFIEDELERNPLLERVDEPSEPEIDRGPAEAPEPVEGDWSREELETDRGALEAGLGTDLENSFDDGGPRQIVDPGFEVQGLSASSWTGSPSIGDGEDCNLERFVAHVGSLHDHLVGQMMLALVDPADRLIGHALIDSIDDAGYLAEPLADVADRLGASAQRVESVLSTIHGFDPTGVGARTVAECLALQLRERDRLDPAMAALVAHSIFWPSAIFRRYGASAASTTRIWPT